MFGLNSGMLIGAAAIAGVAGAIGYQTCSTIMKAENAKLGTNFASRLALEREFAVRREVNLWSLAGDERRARGELIDSFQAIESASAEARARFSAALTREKAAAATAQLEASHNIEELRNAASQMAVDWKSGVIPRDITCGVFNAKGCPAPAYPATERDRADGVEVRDGKKPAAAGSPP